MAAILGRIFDRLADNRVYRRKHWQVPAEIAINQGSPPLGRSAKFQMRRASWEYEDLHLCHRIIFAARLAFLCRRAAGGSSTIAAGGAPHSGETEQRRGGSRIYQGG